MRMTQRIGPRAWLAAALVLLLATCALADPMRVLVVGGGPSPEHNQVAIESNVRYVLHLLPSDASPTVFFADGNPQHQTVLYEAKGPQLSASERLLVAILEGPDAADGGTEKYRAPQLPRLDGATRKADVTNGLQRLADDRTDHGPILLYFTGHGSPAADMNLDDNVFDLWDGSTLSVRELAGYIAKLPPDRPVRLVMVQCFSGAFGNLLFENGDPRGKLVDRDIAGFFATVRERPAAGCTPEVDEREYHDFTGYFFAALTGRDRVGRVVTGADYNHDGHVGMDEAYCYALANDRSIDIPVCTSDVFLRRFVSTSDDDVFATPYSRVIGWARPGQRAALDALSASLQLTGDDRGREGYRRFLATDQRGRELGAYSEAERQFLAARRAARAALLGKWPSLRDTNAKGFATACGEAAAYLKQHMGESPFMEVIAAQGKMATASEGAYARELADSRVIRFVRLYKSVVLAHNLGDGSDQALKQRYARLVASEGNSLLPSYANVAWAPQ